MRYVVDASVLSHYFTADAYSVTLMRLLSRINLEYQIHIPEFCLVECTNVLWKEARFRGLPQPDAERFLEDLLGLPFEVVPIGDLLPQALQIGLHHQLAAYDSLYIALALSLKCPLITLDQKQSEAAVRCGVLLKDIGDFI